MKNSEKLKSKKNAKAIPDNATTCEQHTGKERSDCAEPDAGGFPRTSRRRTKKFFGAAVFQKCCRGVGEQPTFAEQIVFCNLFFLLQLHFLKLANSQFDDLSETSYKFE